jgi:gliding motility-associated-like protein
LAAGLYSLQITDNQGCVVSQSTTLTQPTLALTLSETHQNVSCFAGNNGSIDLSFTGGTGIPTYSWSNGPTTQDVQSLVAGTYTATATDANGCISTLSTTITQPLQAITLAQTSQNVSCFSGNNGAIDLTVAGGTAGYSYSWSNGAQTQDISTLIAGTYTVQVTDANGCIANLSATIAQPALLSSSIAPNNISCFGGSNGSATIAGIGGTLPYSYLWTTGQTGATISNLPIGTYSCTITDANGCQSTSTISLTQPPVLAAQIQVTDVLCFGNTTGSCSSLVTGGVTPYSYSWSSGGNAANANNLPAGTYTVTVTDANSCTTTATATVIEPAAALAITLNGTNNSCFEGTSGAIDATVTGGTTAYSYSWSNGAVLEDISSLASGNYQLTVTDANGCLANSALVITEPTQIQAQLMALQNVSCFGGSDGSIALNASGGTPNYTYSWSNSQTTEDVSSLTSGTYTLVITDQNNCTENFTYTITQPLVLAATISETQPLCFGYTDGQLIANPTGGTIPYSYVWSNGPTTAINGNIPTGSYVLTVTDANGCVYTTNYFLNEPTQLQVSFQVSDTLGCNPLTVDFVNTSLEQFSCVWSTGDGSILNGCSTTYTYPEAGCQDVSLTITSAIGCTNSLTSNDLICVLQSPVAGIAAEPAQLDTSNPTTFITNTSNGAVAYYWYLSDTGMGSFDFQPGFHTFPMYQDDAYSVSLLATAQNGCTDTALLIIPFDNDLILYVPNAFTPDGDDYNNVFKPVLTSLVKEYHLSIYNRWGEILFESYDQAVGWAGFYGDIPVQDGTYIWKLVVSTDGAEKYLKHGHVTVLR